MQVNLSAGIKTALLNSIIAAADAGSGPALLKFYTGTMPSAPSVAIGTQVLLGTLTCSDPFGTVSGNVLTLGDVAADSSADASGTCTWARLVDSAGNGVIDFDVTNTGGIGAIKLNTVSIVAGGPISISATPADRTITV